jgi:subtilase family serine protease
MRLFRALSLLLLVSSYSFAATPDRITGAIDSSQVVELARSLHPKAQPQYDQGAVDPQFKLSYVTLLTSPSASQQRALDKLLADQQDPASPNYHKWLTPEQYGERFGLSQNDLNKITAWLKAQGITVLSVAPGRNSIIVSGTAAQFEGAFQTEIHRYNVDGESHIANTTPLKIPAALSGIVTVVRGLHNFRMKPMGVRRNSGIRPFYTDSQFFALLAPDDIATIYDIKPLYTAGVDGTGQKLAIVGQTDIYLADINNFRSGFGLSQISGCTTNASGVITACSSSSSNLQYIRDPLITDPGAPNKCGDLSEADLDIEWSGATARNAQIIYVNSPATFDSTCTNQTNNGGVENALSLAIQQKVAPVVSMSYGACELMANNDETELQQANSQGMTIVNSSGDTGAAACEPNIPSGNPPFSPAPSGLAVSYPASSPEVTGVGGTAIPLNEFTPQYWSATNGANDGTALSYIPEVTYNDDPEFALYCQGNPSDPFCKQGGTPAVPGWVPLTASATAAQVQEDIWIASGGGGASNCFYETNAGVCLGPGPGPTGGGLAQPQYQQGLSVPGAPAGVRYVPDVALMSSANFPGYIICTATSELSNTGTSASSCASGIASAVDTWQSVIGGTSVASPVFAGMVTILNQYFQGAASTGLGNVNPMLYKLAAKAQTSTGSNGFNHVNTGTNQVSCQPGTPAITGWPPALQCPAGGVLGYNASVADATTGYNLVTGLGSIDLNNLVNAWKAGRTASTTTVAASPTSVVLGQQVTLTATVTQATATGTVSFFNNGSTTALGTGTLSGGTATFQTTTLPVGTDNITATYGGDGYNASSTTATAATVTVTAPDFTWTSSDATHTVLAGQTSMVYHFTATPVGSTTFGAAVTFGCSFSPTDATLTSSSCTFTPPSIAANSPATTVQMTITTAGPNTGTGAAVQRRADKRSPWLPLALPIAGMVMVGLVGRRVSKYSAVAGLCVSLALLGLMAACGGGSSSPPPPPAITVTVTPSTTVNLYAKESSAWPANLTQQKFSATVNNDTNQTVTWAVTGGGANGANGTIDSSGNYTAPASVPSPALVTVTATSPDTAQPGTGKVNIQTPTALGMFTVTVTATEAGTPRSPTVQLTVQ